MTPQLGASTAATAAVPLAAARPPGVRSWLALAVLTLAQLTVWLDNTILNVALKTLSDPIAGLGATTGQLQWTISSYTLAFAALLFTGGVLGDRYGYRRLFVLGMVIFGASSLGAAYAGSATELIVARGAMGVGSALITPATLSLIAKVFDARHRATAFAVWSGASGLAVAAGPLVSGALLERYWWGSVFLVNVPFALVVIMATPLLLPSTDGSRRQRFDAFGVLLSTTGIFALVYGVIEGGHRGRWDVMEVLGPTLAGIALLAAFVAVERQASNPCFDLRLFRNRHFAGASVAVMLAFFGLAGVMYYSNFYLQGARGLSPMECGLAIAPAAVGVFVGAPLSSRLVRRFGIRVVAGSAMLLTVATFYGFVSFDLDTPLSWFRLLMVLQGLGLGAVMAPTTEVMMASLPPDRTGAGSAVSTSMRQLGAALGVAVLGSVLAGVYRDEVTPKLGALPGAARAAASGSAEATRFLAEKLQLPQLVPVADEAFVAAMHVATVVASVVSFLGVIVILVSLPGRAARTPARHDQRTGLHTDDR